MDRNQILNQKTTKEIEIERLSAFPSAPYVPLSAPLLDRPQGVLLSDQIEFYCKHYKLLDPYEERNIKAANYELRVGLNYSVGGKDYPLRLGEVLTIPKFEVAVIEILETVNMPRFVIGRWNIRTKWAYEGLIWVGGPQIDAGFRGILPCPIWNLSSADFKIRAGEEIAIIDFQFTTPPTDISKVYLWRERSRFLFEDYEKPKSALVTEVKAEIEKLQISSEKNRAKVETGLEQSRSRIDSVTAVMFTALGILTAAITLFATKPDTAGQYWWDPTVLWLSAATTVIALMAWVKSRSSGVWIRRIEIFVLAVALVGIGVGCYGGWEQAKHFSQAQMEIEHLKTRLASLEKAKVPAK